MSKSLAKLRIDVIDKLIKKYKSNEEYNRLLSNGFIPEKIEGEYQEMFDEGIHETDGELGSDLELAQYSNFFYLNNGKFIGTEKAGSGFINPVLSKGNISDLSKIPFEVPKTTGEQKVKEQKEIKTKKEEQNIVESEPVKTKEEVQNQIISTKVAEFESKGGKSSEKLPEIITVEESLKLYNDSISDAEIKAWVYYKRLFGNPMNGYEKFYLKASNTKSTIVVTTDSVYLKDQQFRDVKFVPTGTQIGIKTRFKNEYASETYIVVKTELNELYYVPASKVKEEDTFAAIESEELNELVKQKGICYKNGEYVPVPLYTYGNIYDIKEELIGKFNAETNQYEGGYYDQLIEMFGEDVAVWQKQLIEDAIKLKGEFAFNNPEKSKRPFLSKENILSESFKIKELNELSGVSFEKIFEENKTRRNRWQRYDSNTEYSLFEAFVFWFKVTVNDSMLKNTTKVDVSRYYIENKNFIGGSEDLTAKEKEAIKLNAKIEGEEWYQEFIATCLTYNDMLRLNYLFNRTYNSFSKINLAKIPVAFEANRYVFGRENFRLKPVQRDGIAFISASNSGCLAYDVGFGKTNSAIHILAAVIKEGKVKRPLIAVPKPVYNNWIREMFGFWTDGKEKRFEKFEGATFVNGALTNTKYKLNLWYNLSEKMGVENKQVDPYSITIVTYEGLGKIGFSPALRQQFVDELTKIIGNQSVTESESERKKAKQEQDIFSNIGIAESDTVVDIDVCNFDYLVIDEAHNFKNVFGSVQLDEDQNDIWKISKKPSTKRALKAFVLSLYLQKKYSGNVLLLTATPFSNSPLEIFSMMALIGYQNLKKYGIENIHTFLAMFIDTTSEFTVDAMNNIKVDTVIKSFKNKNLLRDILYRHFDYQDNPKLAGIKRPCKINFPNKKINTYLEMSETQINAQALVREEAASYSKENKGAMGRALNWAKNNALSPFLVPSVAPYESIEELVNESPKIKYAIECIKSVKEYHESNGQEMSGQVIYTNRGKAIFDDFKAALEEICGFKKKVQFGDEFVDEVEIVMSAGSDREMERKEIVKDAFNKGYVKVIIGTATIKEGVNLQERGTCLYNLDLDWNPTDFKQLEGRIHRQGNKFRYARIVVPLVQNTLDSFINQKLDEKGKRIQSIWDKTNEYNSLEEDNYVDPMEIKFALIDDENELIKMKSETESKGFKKQLDIAQEKYDSIFKIELSVNEFNDYKKKQEEDIIKTKNKHEKYLLLIAKFKHENELSKKDADRIAALEESLRENISLFESYLDKGDVSALFEVYRNLQRRNYKFNHGEDGYDYKKLNNKDKSMWGDGYDYYDLNELDTNQFPKMIAKYGEIKKFERMTLASYGLTIADDFSIIKDTFKKELDEVKAAIEFTETDAYKEKTLNEIREELRKRAEQRGTIEDRVEQFKSFNYLLSYPFEEELSDNCDLPTDAFGGEFNIQDFDTEEEYVEAVVEEKPVSPKKTFKETTQVLKRKTTVQKEEEEVTKLIPDVKYFLPSFQEKIIRTNPEFEDVRKRLNEIIPAIPKTYETDGITLNEKVAYLHYFYGNMDWYIFEKDMGDGSSDLSQYQAYGMADFGDGSELGYISIADILKQGKVELDLYFEPTKWKDVNKSQEPDEEEQETEIETVKEVAKEAENATDLTKQEYIDLVESTKIALEYAEGQEKQDLQDYIDGLEILIETM